MTLGVPLSADEIETILNWQLSLEEEWGRDLTPPEERTLVEKLSRMKMLVERQAERGDGK